MSRFQVAVDVGLAFGEAAPFPCPFGTGATFFIRYAGSEEHRKRSLARLRKNPVQLAVMVEMFTKRTKPWRPRTGYAAGDQVRVKEDTYVCVTPGVSGDSAKIWEAPGEVVDDGAHGCAWTRAGEDGGFWEDAIEKAVQNGKIDVVDLVAGVEAARDSALDLLAGWENLKNKDGSMEPFSEEAALELLSLPVLVKDGYPYAGKPMGQAYIEFITDSATGRAAFRGDTIEASGKNLPALTVGES